MYDVIIRLDCLTFPSFALAMLSEGTIKITEMLPPPSVLHAMRCLYGIGRDSWVWEMSSHALASMHSSHGVGEYSVTAVWPRAGGLSRRRPHEIIVVAVVVTTIAGSKQKKMRINQSRTALAPLPGS